MEVRCGQAGVLGVGDGDDVVGIQGEDAVGASSSAATQRQAAPTLRAGDLVRVRSGGPLMTVTGVQGDHVNCSWTDWNGDLKSESFPVAVLGLR
jgi:uncharacterized protein YodC (DUF2158 family)